MDSSKLTSEQQAIEYYKCKTNPFYFIYNYVYIPEIGGRLKYNKNVMHGNMKRVVRAVVKHHKCILMATRQLGKSTIAAALLEWAGNFYPGTPAVILNANKRFALENLEKVRFIHENVPAFLRIPLKNKARKTYLEYEHGSLLRVFYPSSTTSADTLARSLTSPILYIDEGAFIRHMEDAYGSAQPTLSRAREQAIKNNYPYFILVTSTPNGTVGTGEWFFRMWEYSCPAVNIYDDDDQFLPEAKEVVDDPVRNGFVQVKYHWREDPSKGDEWYEQQVRDLNFDRRKINQELDLLFVGSTTCIFDDDFLGMLKETAPVSKLKLPHACKLNIYSDSFDVGDYLLIGVDTAKSLVGDYNAIEIFSYSKFIQVAEFFGKLGSLTKYSELLMSLTKYLAKIMNDRIILCIENNSIGTAIIENLENASEDPAHNFDYMQYVYTPTETTKSRTKDQVVEKVKINQVEGINTNAKTKSSMVSFLYDYLIDNPDCVKSSDFISQLNVIERSANGSIRAQTGHHDDLFMAAALCAFVRRMSALEYEPLLENTTIQQQVVQAAPYQTVMIGGPKTLGGPTIEYSEKEGGIVHTTEDKDDVLFDSMKDLKDLVSIF